MYYATKYPSPAGMLTLASDGENLTGLWIEGQKYFQATVPGTMTARDRLPVFEAAADWLNRYFAGNKPSISELPLRPAGSKFRRMIWDLLCEIPYGEVSTYGMIAKKAASLMDREIMSGQAVGGAVGHNPISIIIPCHRVIGSDGSLTGYAGGIGIKKMLLEHEGVNLPHRYTPQKGTAL